MSSNESSTLTLDGLFKLFGSTWYIDMLNVYLIIPISILGLVSNLIVNRILRKERFQTILIFNYIRVNIVNSIFLSLILSTSFLGTYRVFEFTNTYESYFFTAYFYIYFLSLFYFHSNLMDIFAVVERITNFNKNRYLKRFIRHKSLRLLSFIAVIVINIPNLFVSYPSYREFKLNDGSMFRIYYWHPTDFQSSLVGTVIIYSMYFMRDIVTLLAKIVLNIVSIRLIRKYFNRISSQAVLNTTIVDLMTMETVQTKTYMTKVDRNLTFISIIMCVFSSIENILYILSFVYIYFSYDEIAFYLFFLSHLSLAVKQCFNIFLLYFFNSQFRIELKRLMKSFCHT